MNNVLAIILGGGRGTRLYPLTKLRAKPALPLAGKYRLIDIPVSNCINSEVQKIYILTQFNSASLNQHVVNTYCFSQFSKGFVQVLAAQQTPESPDWFHGTADAVRKSLWILADRHQEDDFLILSGDHLYQMDFRPFIEHHRKMKADATVSVIPLDESMASQFGLLKTDDAGKIIEFKEKPTNTALQSMRVNTPMLNSNTVNVTQKPFIASMGIYIFKRQVLIDLLNRYPTHTDFGKDIIPSAIREGNVYAYLFNGYWEDIGTIETFYHANLKLVRQPHPDFSFYNVNSPIYTHARFLPPSKILDTDVKDAMICDGCIIKSKRIQNSIIGIRSRLDLNTIIENSLIMGADIYQSDLERENDIAAGRPPIGVGANTYIKNAIIDKNVRIGKNVQIINKNNIQSIDYEQKGYAICSGIVIVLKNATILIT